MFAKVVVLVMTVLADSIEKQEPDVLTELKEHFSVLENVVFVAHVRI